MTNGNKWQGSKYNFVKCTLNMRRSILLLKLM